MSRTKFTRGDHIFRKLLKEIRIEKKLTQTELATRLKRPQSYVSKYETGERRLDFVETSIVCEKLGIELDEFARTFIKRLGGKS